MAYVCRGYMPEDPESDAIRADVDRRLQAKVPAREFVPWFGRYPMQQQTTLEEEHAVCGKKWRKR